MKWQKKSSGERWRSLTLKLAFIVSLSRKDALTRGGETEEIGTASISKNTPTLCSKQSFPPALLVCDDAIDIDVWGKRLKLSSFEERV